MNHEPRPLLDRPAGRSLMRAGAISGVIAAIANTAIAAVADARGVELAFGETTIPIAAFALWTLVGAAVGIGAARLLRWRKRFVVVATVLTGLSLIPPLALPDDLDTKAVLVATHLVAAALIIPALGYRLNNRTTAPKDLSSGV